MTGAGVYSIPTELYHWIGAAGYRIRADCGDKKHKNHACSSDNPGAVCIASRLRQS
jgi:hypothetical protein